MVSLLYGKQYLRLNQVLWLAILQSGFYSIDHCHGNSPFGYFPLDHSAPGKFKLRKHKSIKSNARNLVWKAKYCRFSSTGFLRHHKREIPWHRAENWLEWTTGSIVAHTNWCHIINYSLTSLAWDRIGEYWPLVVFVWTEHSEVRTKTTKGQYSLVRPSRSVSKRLISSLELVVSKAHICFTYIVVFPLHTTTTTTLFVPYINLQWYKKNSRWSMERVQAAHNNHWGLKR